MAATIKQLTPKQKSDIEKSVKLTVKKYRATLVKLAQT
jgi:hypothetical protein